MVDSARRRLSISTRVTARDSITLVRAGDDFPSATKPSAIFSLPRHAATRLFQMKLAAWATPIGTAQTQGFPHGVRRKSSTLSSAVLPVSMPGGPSRDPEPQIRLVCYPTLFSLTCSLFAWIRRLFVRLRSLDPSGVLFWCSCNP